MKRNVQYNKNEAKSKSLISKDYEPGAIDSSLNTGRGINSLPAVSKGKLLTDDLLPTVKIDQNPLTVKEMDISKNQLLRDKINQGEQVLAKDVMQTKAVTTFDEEGNAIDRSDDKSKIKVFDAEYDNQKKYERIDSNPEFFDFKTPQELQNKFETRGAVPGKGMVSSIVNAGEMFNRYLDNTGQNIAMQTTDVAQNAKDYLISNGLATQADASAPIIFDRKLANSLSAELVDAIQQSIYVQAVVAAEEKADTSMTLDELDSYFGTMNVEDAALAVKGTELLPEYIEGTLARKVINNIVKNPYQKEIQTRNKERDPKLKTMYTGVGGAGNELQSADDKTFAYLDTVLWSAVNDADFIDKIIGVDGRVRYAMNTNAVDFFDQARPYIMYANRTNKIGPSLTRPEDGEYLPFSVKDTDMRYTVKSLRSSVDAIQRRTKDNISAVKFRINPYLDNWLVAKAEVVIGKIPFEDGRHQFGKDFQFVQATNEQWQWDKSKALASDEDVIKNYISSAPIDKFKQPYGSVDRQAILQQVLSDPKQREQVLRVARLKEDKPTHPWGKALFSDDKEWAPSLKLDQKKWEDAYYKAMRDENLNQAEAVAQANTVMMSQAKQVLLDIQAAKEYRQSAFYLPSKDIGANGRYHYVGNVINPQASKTMRQIMANGNARAMDLANLNDKEKERLAGAKYVIAKNILPKSMTKGIKTSNMGWNAITEAMDRVLSRSTPEYLAVYSQWLKLGQLIRGIGTRVNVNPLKLLQEIEIFGQVGRSDRKSDLVEIMKGLQNPEEWGMVMQSYIDFANYHDAMESLKKNRKKIDAGVTYIDRDITGQYMTPEIEERLGVLTQGIQEAREADDEATAAQYESEVFELSKQFSFKQQPLDSTMFNPLALAQIDGKQNGLAIQAFQSGDVDTLRLVGMIYESEENVIPQGDIRKRFGKNTLAAVKSKFKKNDEKIEFWGSVFKRFNMSNRADKIMKELSKQPLMETSYGKWRGFHFETAEDFLRGEYGAMITDAIGTSDIPGYTEANALDDLTEIISKTLDLTLDLETQQLHKDLGQFYSFMGTTPSFKGPLGNTVYLGSKEFVGSGESIEVMTAQGIVDKPLGRVVSTGQKRAKQKKVLDKISGAWKKAELTPYGQEIKNQIVVLPTQHIDGGVMAIGVNYANRGRRPSEDAEFQIPVHDSLIFDGSSARNIHRSINRAFNDVNANYSTNRALLEGLVDTEKAFMNEIRKSSNATRQKYHVTLESTRWRALHDYLRILNEEAEEKANLNQNESREINALLTKVSANGWTPQGSVLTGNQLAQVIMAVGKYINIKPRMEYATAESDRKKGAAMKELTTGSEKMVDENGQPVLDSKGNFIFLPEPYQFN